jgi:hypothetical protein
MTGIATCGLKFQRYGLPRIRVWTGIGPLNHASTPRQSSDYTMELSKLRGWIDEEAAFRSHSEW